MRRAILVAVIAVVISVGTTGEASAQGGYTYTVTRTRTVPIDWRPENKTHQRYTVSVSPLRLANNGLKFDFERELPRSGHWFGTSLIMYFAPPRSRYNNYVEYDNNRASFNSGFGDYHRMWGLGTSAIFKNTFSHRGWYFATGIVFDFFRVGVSTNAYVPYVEEGMTFYDYGRTIETKSYFKPTAQIYIGKHMAISERCFLDLYAGIGLSYSFYKHDDRHVDTYDYGYGYGYGYDYNYHYNYRNRFDDVGGFAWRGLVPVSGFRFGVMLWKPM